METISFVLKCSSQDVQPILSALQHLVAAGIDPNQVHSEPGVVQISVAESLLVKVRVEESEAGTGTHCMQLEVA